MALFEGTVARPRFILVGDILFNIDNIQYVEPFIFNHKGEEKYGISILLRDKQQKYVRYDDKERMESAMSRLIRIMAVN